MVEQNAVLGDFDRETYAMLDELRELRARVAELEAKLEEREADMHMRIRADYDRTVADCWRAKVAEQERELVAARAIVAMVRADFEDGVYSSSMVCADALQAYLDATKERT